MDTKDEDYSLQSRKDYAITAWIQGCVYMDILVHFVHMTFIHFKTECFGLKETTLEIGGIQVTRKPHENISVQRRQFSSENNVRCSSEYPMFPSSVFAVLG